MSSSGLGIQRHRDKKNMKLEHIESDKPTTVNFFSPVPEDVHWEAKFLEACLAFLCWSIIFNIF